MYHPLWVQIRNAFRKVTEEGISLLLQENEKMEKNLQEQVQNLLMILAELDESGYLEFEQIEHLNTRKNDLILEIKKMIEGEK